VLQDALNSPDHVVEVGHVYRAVGACDINFTGQEAPGVASGAKQAAQAQNRDGARCGLLQALLQVQQVDAGMR